MKVIYPPLLKDKVNLTTNMMAAAMLSPVKLMKLAMNPLEEELDGLVGHAWKLAGLLWPILAIFCISLVG